MRIAIAALLALAACAKKSAGNDARTQECERLYGKLEQAAAAMGADDLGEAKAQFMATCKTATEDLLPCLADPASAPDCAAKLTGAKRKGPPPKLAWKTVALDDGRVSARVPDGWDHEEFRGDTYAPPKSADLGFFTELSIETSCGGTCEPLPAAEWAKRAEDQLAHARNGFAVDKDEALGATGHLVVSHNLPDSPSPSELHVLAAFWGEGGDHYVTCRAELDPEIGAALAEFEQACRDVKVTSFNATEH